MSSGVGSNSGGRDMDASEVGVSLLDETVVKTNGRLRALSSDRAPSDTSEQLHFPWEKIGPPEEGIFQKFLKKSKSGYAKRRQTYTWLDWLGVFLPCVSWLRTYKIREYLLPDIIAGISVGFMVIPQGMSYANLAGLPSVYGLYGAFLPVLAYALIGSSRHLAVGPVAVTSLLLGSSLKDIVEGADQIANPNSPGDLADVQQKYNVAAIQIAFLVSILYTSVGVFRLGFITNFLSHSVIGGFTSGAAITIGLSQLKYILGINVARKDALHEQIKEYIDNMPDFKWQEFIMGMTLLVLLVSFKEVGKRSQRFRWLRPLGPITACIISLCAVYIGKVDQYGIKIIGSIPKGLPKPTVQWWAPMPDFVKLIPVAIVVMVVDLLESTSIARALAVKNNYELNSNQEITGLGLANLAGAAFNAYTTTGSFSRSAVNNDSGAKTALSGFITAWVVAFVLLFLTPVFSKLTYNALGAIVVSAVTGLLEYEQAINLFKINKLDWLVWMASFLGTLFISIEIGLGISIGLALLIVVYESAFPHTALLGRIPNTGVYRNVKQYPDASVFPGIMLCRIDAPMYFANVQWIRDRMRKYEKAAAEYSAVKGMQLEYIIIDMSPVTHIDATGVHALESWINDHHAAGMQTIICNPNSKVIRCLETAGVPDLIGREWVFVTVHDAVSFCTRALTEKGHVVQGEPSRTLKALTQGSMRTGTSLSGAVGENGVNGVNGTPGNGVHVAVGMTLPVNRSSASDSE